MPTRSGVAKRGSERPLRSFSGWGESGGFGGRRALPGILHRTCSRAGGESRADFHLQMDENGIYKAMGEFDIFINYIEEYLLMRRRK